jgi:predicted nucleic acid-binding protein
VILVDTSAWVEFLRGTNSAVCESVDRLLGDELAICDAISMELLAGARDESHLLALRRLLGRTTVLPTTPADYDEAAALYRTCRRQGATVRRLIDCLIASVALRHDVPVLHAASDFDVMARHTALRVRDPLG